ncbi:MAG: hydrogenase expression/formation protein HypE [archaeon]
MRGLVKLAHGAGGTLMEQAILDFTAKFSTRSALDGVGIDAFDDGATLKLGEHEVVATMDGHTVNPIFFPGGDIGRLAICGAVNDLAMMGAKPVAILDSVMVEEGFPFSDLDKIAESMEKVASETAIAIIGGDFKVMPKGTLDKIVIATCGLGLAERGKVVLDSGARPGDKVIVTGSIGDHGIALLSAREQLGFDTDLESDVRPIWKTVEAALSVGGVSSMKDATRGGLASTLNDIACKSHVSIWLDDEQLPIKGAVSAASEMLGLNPLEITCEGVAIICVEGKFANDALDAVASTPYGREASIVGEVRAERPGYVLLKTEVGGTRVVEKPLGELIPRVC